MESSIRRLLSCVSALVVGAFFTGCATIPFDKTPLPRLPADIEPGQVVEDFAAALPSRFVTDDTLVFRFLWREMAALGFSRVDRRAGTFEVLCLNHMGVQLFYITGDQETSELQYAIPEIARQEGFVEAVGSDIRRVYFNLLPAPEARAMVRRNRLVFSQATRDGTLRHVFGGPDLALLEKSHHRRWRRGWQVNYYEYESSNGLLVPRGIVLHNRRHNYRLLLKIREVTLSDKE